jgi:hypothetical protein
MAAQLELPIENWRSNGLNSSLAYLNEEHGSAGLDVEPMARPSWRVLAAYLLTHYRHCGHDLSELAQILAVPPGHLHNMLTGQVLPSPQILTALVEAIGADLSRARQFYDAAGADGPRPSHQTHTPGWPHIDHYLSIISSFVGDNPRPYGLGKTPPGALVAPAFGDNDTADPAEDHWGTSTAAMSPPSGDTTVASDTATGPAPGNPQDTITLNDIGRVLWSNLVRLLYRGRHNPRRD